MLAEELGGEYCAGDQLYDVLHFQQMKHIARMERPFHPRDYVSVDPVIVRNRLAGKKIFIVDDLLTTGGSVKDFIRGLNDDGVNVTCVVALAGDPRLQVDEKTRAALKNALQAKGFDLPAEELADSLTRTEAGRIILLIRSVRTENGKQKLTRKLQGILDRRPVENVVRDPEQGRYFGSQGKDPGLEPDDERIQPWGVFENGQRELKPQQIARPIPESEEKRENLPDDLPSLEALWKVEIQKLLEPIQARARPCWIGMAKGCMNTNRASLASLPAFSHARTNFKSGTRGRKPASTSTVASSNCATAGRGFPAFTNRQQTKSPNTSLPESNRSSLVS